MIVKTFGADVASCGIESRSHIIYAMEFDWRNEWPGGASESIVARVILNLTVFPSSGRIPREDSRSLLLFLSTLSSRFCRRRSLTFSFTYGNILPISLSMQISIRERQYLLNRAEKGFWCTGILSAIERTFDFREKDSAPRWKIKTENFWQMRMK